MVGTMARSTIHFLRKRGMTQATIAAPVGCERRTVARVLEQPVDHRYRRRTPLSAWASWEPAIGEWLDAKLPIKRMLEVAR